MMTDGTLAWRDHAEIDNAMIGGLVSALGAAAFEQLKSPFTADLTSLAASYLQARNEHDDAAARTAAHALRGAALNIGLNRLGHLAGTLEAGKHQDEAELEAVLATSLACLHAAG